LFTANAIALVLASRILHGYGRSIQGSPGWLRFESGYRQLRESTELGCRLLATLPVARH